jgi:hypothetical protein
MGNPIESSQAPGRSIEDYWSDLTDNDLRKIIWVTTDPLALANVQQTIPEYLSAFTIELAYDLDRGDPPVPCAHCPQHQPHWHGFVLKDCDGKRYLLGSHCGPKDLDRARAMLNNIASAGMFFSADAMARLTAWARDGLEPHIGTLSWTNNTLRVADNQGDQITLSLQADWTVPGEAFRPS